MKNKLHTASIEESHPKDTHESSQPNAINCDLNVQCHWIANNEYTILLAFELGKPLPSRPIISSIRSKIKHCSGLILLNFNRSNKNMDFPLLTCILLTFSIRKGSELSQGAEFELIYFNCLTEPVNIQACCKFELIYFNCLYMFVVLLRTENILFFRYLFKRMMVNVWGIDINVFVSMVGTSNVELKFQTFFF